MYILVDDRDKYVNNLNKWKGRRHAILCASYKRRIYKFRFDYSCFCLVLIEIFGRFNRPESDKELEVNYKGENSGIKGNRNAMLLLVLMSVYPNVEVNP